MNWLRRGRARTATRVEHVLRQLYLRLPITSRHRWTIKRWGFRLGSWMLSGTASYQRWAATERMAAQRSRSTARALSDADISRLVSTMVLPTSAESPAVSIVIPVYGQLADTLRCLAAIGQHPPAASFELIVVDDCSTDATATTLENMSGLRLIRTSENVGFIGSCNTGAAAARGRHLIFLNNDTEPQPMWADELLRTFIDRPDAGIVGAKLLYPDGRLQEAGGIIWRDGSAWNYGRSQDATKPEYNYRRDVDYVSGAVLAIPRDLFLRLGGFDDRYAPAYGEDSDLAFKVRELGYAVLYQPLAQVVHREGATAGTDVTRGIKAYQQVNAKKLYARWQSRLVDRPAPGTDVIRARDRRDGLRVLVLDHCTPEPDKDAGSITALNLMRLLQRAGCHVTFVPEDNYLFLDRYTADMQRMGIECLYAPHVASIDEHVATHGHLYDLVVIFRFTAARRRLAAIRRACRHAKVILHTSDLHFLRLQRQADLARDSHLAHQAERARAEELDIIRCVDATIVHSSVEAAIIHEHHPDAVVCTFGWAIEIPGTTTSFTERRDLALVGGYQHPPNADAAVAFVHDILPLVRARLPGVVLHIIGSNPPDEVRELAATDVVVSGYVPDLVTALSSIRVAVAPLRYGAGIKGKVVTTMSQGLPNVLTTIAAEGLDCVHGEHAMVADTPEAFADAVAALYTNEALWSRISQQALARTHERFSMTGGDAVVADILTAVGLKAMPTPTTLRPLAPTDDLRAVSSRTLDAYRDQAVADAADRDAMRRENAALAAHSHGAAFVIAAYCVNCQAPSELSVGWEYSLVDAGGVRQPNWREHLVCTCGLNARGRAVVHAMTLDSIPVDAAAYVMEQHSPLYRALRHRFPALTASEYVGDDVERGHIVDGVRHEDATHLSFADETFDLVVSCDVLEHVPDYRRALAECCRCLRVSGRLLITAPFAADQPTTIIRARVKDGAIEHVLSPEYHGDPLRPDAGILCYQHFGWDVLADLTAAGFRDADVLSLSSRAFGYRGDPQLIIRAIK